MYVNFVMQYICYICCKIKTRKSYQNIEILLIYCIKNWLVIQARSLQNVFSHEVRFFSTVKSKFIIPFPLANHHSITTVFGLPCLKRITFHHELLIFFFGLSRPWCIFDIQITGIESTKVKLHDIFYQSSRTINTKITQKITKLSGKCSQYKILSFKRHTT